MLFYCLMQITVLNNCFFEVLHQITNAYNFGNASKLQSRDESIQITHTLLQLAIHIFNNDACVTIFLLLCSINR